MKKLTDAAIVALIVWLDASDRNAKDTDENWAKGFRAVQCAQDALHKHFTPQEITGFIVNKESLRAIINPFRARADT